MVVNLVPTLAYSERSRSRHPLRFLLRLLFVAALLSPDAVPAQAQTVTPTDRRQVPGQNNDRAPQNADTAPVKADPNDGDTENGIDDSYRARGINLESFLLLPKFEADEKFNSNIYGETLAKGDFQTVLRPSFALHSRFPQHALNVSGQLEDVEHIRFTQDNHLDGYIQTDGRYDLNRAAFINASFQYSGTHEDRGDNNDAQGRTPTPIESVGGTIGTTVQDGRYSFGVSGTGTRLTYGNVSSSLGTPIANDLRDRTEGTGTLRAGYELFPGYVAVAEGTANTRQYDTTADASGFNRDSDGYVILTGVGLDITSLLRGDFLAGYMQQFYQDPRFKPEGGPTIKVTLDWTPDRQTLIVPSLERSINETTLASASSFIHNSVSVMARHELQRNITLSGFFTYGYDEFPGTSQFSSTYQGQVRAAYALNRNLYLGTEVSYENKSTSLANRSFDRFILGLRLGTQF